ncbi:hypothetical protein EI94DRAFT_1609035 [Lactarius quietus]|nr:hypothetical protein EI94DRAFT_1609035 [Lactarius quietus]
MPLPVADVDSNALRSVIEHVFMPPKLPQAGQDKKAERELNVAICHTLIEAARNFLQDLPYSQRTQWGHMIKMMESVRQAAKFPFGTAALERTLSSMTVGDVFVMHIRAQNAAVIIRRLAHASFVQFEVFEVLPPPSAVMSAKGKLLCSYPGPAIQVPTDTFANESFLCELSSFLVQMDVDVLDSAPTTSKAGSVVHEVRESAHPRYISELLVGILRGFGQPAVVDRITKRVGDEVLWDDAYTPWRRSPLWLILRVSLQTSLRVTNMYKTFMLFFHSYLLRTSLCRNFPSELLYAMTAKIARRLSKLRLAVPHHVYDFVHNTAKAAEALLQQRWSDFQAIASLSSPWLPETLDPVADAAISLDVASSHLREMTNSTLRTHSPKRFNPTDTPRLDNTSDFEKFTEGRLAKAIAKDGRIALADFELSVEKYLASWTTASLHNNLSPGVIVSCVEQYVAGAKDFFGTAEDNSIMILTILDLWVAIDIFAIQQCPLLKQYSPEIPAAFLHPLLLHHSGSLKRALFIEEYLCRRHGEAVQVTSIFSNNVSESSFSVQYFRSSESLQRLYDDVNTRAHESRAEKRAELAKLNQQAYSLSKEASTLDHKQIKDSLGNDIHNSGICKKCKLEHQSKSLTIHAHEWPLPSSTLQAQRAVFELSPPPAFSIWRDTTYLVLRDLGMSEVSDSRDQPKLLLHAFSGLSPWVATRQARSRITVGSTTKSFFDNTHYKTIGIPAEESSVLLNNGLSLRLFDRVRNSWVVGSLSESSVKSLCTPPVPTSSPYSSLHFSVSGTQHSSNEIIAAQANCPKELSIHEFIAYAGLRSGPRLQWLNIARELASPYLSFRREEVHMLITQAAWQLGPLSDGVRDWHIDLSIASFGKTLLHELETLIEKIAANWLEEVTVRTIALICSRLIASATDPEVCKDACALLRKARDLTYGWIRDLGARLESTNEESSREGLRRRLCLLAMTCFSTFDVCPEYIPRIFSDSNDLSMAVQCAVIVHDNAPSTLADESTFYLSRMLHRHHRLLHFLEPVFSLHKEPENLSLNHKEGYGRAVSSFWPGYSESSTARWKAVPTPNSRWIFCLAEGGQKIHYNLLTGQLLVNGKPLGKLPQDIMDHPTYADILGARVLDVVPADVVGMEFMTRSTVSGYQASMIPFSVNEDITLQARQPGCSQLLQLVPRSTLSSDLPRHFIDEYFHWLDRSTGEVEFRPTGSPWTSSPSNWRLHFRNNTALSHIMLRKRTTTDPPEELVDIRSATFGMVSSLLSSLETPEHIIVSQTEKVLEVSLPRLHLSFFVNETSELECRSIPGYVVDETQSIGTMFGLKTRLVLCPSRASPEGYLLPRRIIIPQGEVSFAQHDDFASVSIGTTGADKHVRWHEYIIDTNLRCLTTNSGLSSKLYACYLHALTSHCLPDPLLGHTGTEEALNRLRSAACLSFQRLDPDSAKLLQSISNLSPGRVYYPPHLRSMVTVMWNKLPALSQHHDFYTAVCSILDHARALEALYDKPNTFESSGHNQFLLDRVASRNNAFYPQDLQSASKQSPPKDVEYKSRDIPEGASPEFAVYRTTWSIWNSKLSLDSGRMNLWDVLNSWGSLGPASSAVSMRYSRYWLEFDAAEDWLAIYELCRKATFATDPQDLRIKLSFCLSAVSFSKSKWADFVTFLAVIATNERFRSLHPPSEISYTLSDGLCASLTHLRDLITECALPIHLTPANSFQVPATNRKKINKRRRMEYEEAVKRESLVTAQAALSHWPDYLSVEIPAQWFDKSDCLRLFAKYLQSISKNILFESHIQQVRGILQHSNDHHTDVPTAASYTFTPCFTASPSTVSSCLIRDVLAFRAPSPTRKEPPLRPTDSITLPVTSSGTNSNSAGQNGLQSLIHEFQHTHEPLLQLYGNDLRKSHQELAEKGASQIAQLGTFPSHDSLRLYRDECSRRKDMLFSELFAALSPTQGAEKVLDIAGLWPRISPRSVLRLLARNRIGSLPDQWKPVITRYAVAFLEYQQSQRLLELAFGGKNEAFFREAKTICKDVAAESTHDWLLIQIEANVLARPVQLSIAREMISPSSERSITLQLNMGEGKSSVIVPLVTSTLANGSNLMRVVTPKPLSNQMFELLVGRLSGLANRPIFYVPFSRSLRLDTSLVRTISDLYRRCVDEGGVLVVQPEHILSQKLMRINFLLKSHSTLGKLSIANDLGVLEEWVTKVSRDVMDESDEILHVRYQLVYTAGEQMPVDDHPNRWVTIQEVLGRLKVHAMRLRSIYPKMLEFNQAQRGFPTVRILDRAISQKISSLIIDDALGGALSTISLAVLSPPIREAIRRFVVNKHVTDEDRGSIFSRCAGSSLWCGILLLRGLLMGGEGILGYVLEQRRWRVDYGLDPSRTLLAVPYRAKDVPSLRAEFGHPDVAIALTCLSYYYGGLSKDQMLQCFDLLTKLDDPEGEYDRWVESEEDLPLTLRQLNGVNTKDETVVDESLFPLFSRNMRVVDFYLSRVVFPRSAREFPSKLPTSAWDLVEEKENMTTGFSGTNDNRYLLPTSITQEDPLSELGTNALVLQYLLQPENDFYECTGGSNGEQESAAAFLRRLVKKDPEIRVLLDVGAQMLELQNEDLARHWLSLRPDVLAAVFFNDSDHLTVLTQSGSLEPLVSSPLNRQLEKCVVYLDDAHTRGTDLKLPTGTRAAVTLGPKVTKDRLMQGCMRMRQLGKGHSVMFFAPAEVDRCIRGLIPNGDASGTSGGRIRVLDVLRWAMHETCEDIRRHLPHWAQQGLDHHKRFSAYKQYSSTKDIDALRGAWMQAESRTLEQTYDPILGARGPGPTLEINDIPALRKRIELLAVMKSIDVRMAEEQEREVNHEIEIERQVEQPVKVKPAQDVIHEDIRTFVNTGKVPISSRHILSLFVPAGLHMILSRAIQWSPSPLATAGFATTTTNSVGTKLTDYLRPVNWILSSGSGKGSTIVVISPYEANELLPVIRKSKDVRLHIYAPRVSASMRSFSDLTFYSIPESTRETWTSPAHVRTLFNLFAGQLYFDSREEYERVCVLLGLHMAHPGAMQIEVDGFVLPKYRTREASPFSTSPVTTFKQLTGLRRKGMGYGGTDLGRVLNGRPLGNDQESSRS